MNEASAHLRRTAILLASLDPATAANLLQSLDASQQAAVQSAVSQLDGVPDRERKQVITAFLRQLRATDESTSDDAGNAVPGVPEPPACTIDRVLTQATADALTQLVLSEHPQTSAVIVARVSPDRAAKLLGTLPPAQRTQIIQRILDLQPADPDVLNELTHGIAQRIDRSLDEDQGAPPQQPGTYALRAILDAADPQLRATFVDSLRESEWELARQVCAELDADDDAGASDQQDLASALATFDRIVDFESSELEAMFGHVGAPVVALALAGASQPCREDVLGRISATLAELIRRELGQLGPVRIDDLACAQQLVLAAAPPAVPEVDQTPRRLRLSA